MKHLPTCREVVESVWAGLDSPASRRGYESDWRRYREWSETETVDILAADTAHVQRYLEHLRDAGKAKATRQRAASVIREVYAALVRRGLIEVNPGREVKNPRGSSAPRTPWLDEGNLRKLLTLPLADGDPWKARRDWLCVLLLVGLGWRGAEVARIEVEDFRERGDGQVTATAVVKGGKQITVLVPTWLWAVVRAWREYARIDTGPLLPRSAAVGSTAVSYDMVYDIVAAAAKRAGLPPKAITPHGLRRTFITEGRLHGETLDDLQHAVGHASKSTTERYEKAARAAQRAVGEWIGGLLGDRGDAETNEPSKE